jgi:hypothetical protein
LISSDSQPEHALPNHRHNNRHHFRDSSQSTSSYRNPTPFSSGVSGTGSRATVKTDPPPSRATSNSRRPPWERRGTLESPLLFHHFPMRPEEEAALTALFFPFFFDQWQGQRNEAAVNQHPRRPLLPHFSLPSEAAENAGDICRPPDLKQPASCCLRRQTSPSHLCVHHAVAACHPAEGTRTKSACRNGKQRCWPRPANIYNTHRHN